MVVSKHQVLGWPGTDSPSLLLGHILVWTSRLQNWERFHFHCLSPSLCGPVLDHKLPRVGPGPPSFQMCEGSVSFSESLPLSFSPQYLAENCSPFPISPSPRAQLYHQLCQIRALAQPPTLALPP